MGSNIDAVPVLPPKYIHVCSDLKRTGRERGTASKGGEPGLDLHVLFICLQWHWAKTG